MSDDDVASVRGGGKKDPPTSQGAQEFKQTRGETSSMWERTSQRTPILADFSSFSPSSNLCGDAVKPRRSQSSWSKCYSISKRSTENFTEVEMEHPCSRQLDLAVATPLCVRPCPAGLRHFFLLGKVALAQGDFT